MDIRFQSGGMCVFEEVGKNLAFGVWHFQSGAPSGALPSVEEFTN